MWCTASFDKSSNVAICNWQHPMLLETDVSQSGTLTLHLDDRISPTPGRLLVQIENQLLASTEKGLSLGNICGNGGFDPECWSTSKTPKSGKLGLERLGLGKQDLIVGACAEPSHIQVGEKASPLLLGGHSFSLFYSMLLKDCRRPKWRVPLKFQGNRPNRQRTTCREHADQRSDPETDWNLIFSWQHSSVRPHGTEHEGIPDRKRRKVCPNVVRVWWVRWAISALEVDLGCTKGAWTDTVFYLSASGMHWCWPCGRVKWNPLSFWRFPLFCSHFWPTWGQYLLRGQVWPCWISLVWSVFWLFRCFGSQIHHLSLWTPKRPFLHSKNTTF